MLPKEYKTFLVTKQEKFQWRVFTEQELEKAPIPHREVLRKKLKRARGTKKIRRAIKAAKRVGVLLWWWRIPSKTLQ